MPPSTRAGFAALLASPNPAFGVEEIAALAAREWGLEGRVDELGSTQDQNFRVRTEGGDYVLKIANRASGPVDLEAGDAAMGRLREAAPGFAVPEVVPTLGGARFAGFEGHLARLVTWVDGTPLCDVGDLDAGALHGLGELAARCALGLAPLRHPSLERDLQWESRQAPALVAELIDSVGDPGRRALSVAAIAPLEELMAGPAAAALPVQAIHCDVTDFNVAARVEGGRIVPCGLIDFGDVVYGWRATEAAHAAMSAVFHDLGDPLGGVAEVLAGFVAASPLEEAEAEAIWPLILARAVVCALSSTHQAGLAGASPHLSRLLVEDWATLEAVLAVPAPVAVAAMRIACGFPAHPGTDRAVAALAAAGPAEVVATPAPLHPVDLSVGSELLAFGAWEDAAGIAAATAGEGTAVGRWGEVRIAAAGIPEDAPPATLHTGVDLFVAAGTEVRSPLAGRVTGVGEWELELAAEPGGVELTVRLAGLEPAVPVGAEAEAGAPLGVVAPATERMPPHLHVQLGLAPGVPGLVQARHREAALALCPDPGPLLGVEAAAPPPGDPRLLAERRRAVIATPQRLYYDDPPQFVRGWRHLLYDSDGRPYVDSVNNVALVGHSHPAIAAAAARPLRLLNTNSRFLYGEIVDYAERLRGLLPAELDRVFLVNSGSEAVDLALRLARAYTGREDVVAIEGAYHGWTGTTFELCTNPQDRPAGGEELSPRVHLAAQPDPYRGAGGAEAAPYVDSVRAACAAAADRSGLAAFVAEPLLGNQGGVEPPPGYLAAAYEAVRAAGGVCVADEIQVGFGRTGPGLWAFAHEGVVPDVVCVAKAAGNGYPLGAVVCRAEIAASLDQGAGFFSSPAGSPLSCAVGSAVIDVLLEERLPENAARIGAFLRAGFEELAGRHEPIGAVHGRGLYMGVDLVTDRATKEPAPALADRVCERMRSLGVVMQPTGDAGNVLKVKPPLCLDQPGAERIVSALDRAFEDFSKVADE